MAVAALAEYSMGRRLWGTGGVAGTWSGDINSAHNSQFIADPYTFTHILHGVLFYGILALAFRKWPPNIRLIVAAELEAAWEVLENSDYIINRYRAETISLNYYGDSIVNSMSDVLACIAGFWLASKLPPKLTLALAVIVEIVLFFWIRDNLTLNIVMLIRPSRLIRAWQLGR